MTGTILHLNLTDDEQLFSSTSDKDGVEEVYCSGKMYITTIKAIAVRKHWNVREVPAKYPFM